MKWVFIKIKIIALIKNVEETAIQEQLKKNNDLKKLNKQA